MPWLPALLSLSALLARPADAAEGDLRLGLQGGAVREDLLVPLGFGGGGLRLGGGLEAALGPGALDARADLGLRLLADRFGHLAASIDYGIDARYLLPVADGAWAAEVGPALALDSRVSYLESWDDAHGYWLGTQWLGPALRLRRPLGDRALEIGLAGALIGAAGRPPTYRYRKQDALKSPGWWLAQPHRGESLATPARLQAVRLDLGLDLPRRPGKAGRWSVGLDSRFARYDAPATTIDLGTALWASRSWGAP